MRDQTQKKLTIFPLGGLGEIGMNAMVIAYGEDAVVIDCGVLFPDADLPGVDYVIPDLSVLKQCPFKVRAYVITHGHEDHIGALPYALSIIDAPIYASRFTCGLIEQKLNEWKLTYDLKEVKVTDCIQIGCFEFEFIKVTHSIPDSFALSIQTPLGRVIHTGDFKIDHRPVDGQTTDLGRFAKDGQQGVLLLLSDSTNAEVPGVSWSEKDIEQSLTQIITQAQGRVFIASFSSHIHRMQLVINISLACGRKIAFNGRSMLSNMTLARRLGLLSVRDQDIVDMDQVSELDPSKITILTTGSQAEPTSAIAKLAYRDPASLVAILPQDVVIFSSRAIPGNERSISRAINGLMEQGARVVYSQVAKVHTSGHAYQDEQRLMLNLVKPRFFIPVHGEYRHMSAHADIAESCGVARENIFILKNGDSLEIAPHKYEIKAMRGPHYPIRKILVDGDGVGDVNEEMIRERQQMAHGGLFICVAHLDAHDGHLCEPLTLKMRGITDLTVSTQDDVSLLKEAEKEVSQVIAEQTRDTRLNQEKVEEVIRVGLRRFWRKQKGRRPVILPFVIYSSKR